MSGGGCNISLGDYTEKWKAQHRLVHSSLQRCCKKSLHDVIERQALHLLKVQLKKAGKQDFRRKTLQTKCSG